MRYTSCASLRLLQHLRTPNQGNQAGKTRVARADLSTSGQKNVEYKTVAWSLMFRKQVCNMILAGTFVMFLMRGCFNVDMWCSTMLSLCLLCCQSRGVRLDMHVFFNFDWAFPPTSSLSRTLELSDCGCNMFCLTFKWHFLLPVYSHGR